MKRHPPKAPVVLVDDDASVLFSSRMLLRSVGIKPVEALGDSRELLPLLARQEPGVVVLDLFMPHLSGIDLLPEIVRRHPDVPVIVMTAAQEVDTAVACMKEGAFDYLVKPVEESRFVSSVRRALELRSLRRQVGALKRYLLTDELEHGDAFSSIVTASRRMRSLFQYVEAVAGSGEPVMLTGESGVGKELLARALHDLSGREGEFVQVNVAGLDDALLSDTLFGHDEGAFTGATGARKGLVARASGGTLLLDEIGDLETASQVKLLRLLQERSYYALGSDLARRADVRVVCATNRDLAREMKQGGFRPDLYYRLTVHHADIPPLRERREDIPVLVRHFIDEAAEAMGKAAPDPPAELITLLSNHHFPGNVRELRAMVYDAVALHPSGPVLSMERFRDAIERQQSCPTSSPDPVERRELLQVTGRFPTLAEAETWLVDEALSRAGGNQGIAATLLGLSRPALNRRLARRRSRGESDGGV